MIKINGSFIQDNELSELIETCKTIAKEAEMSWSDRYDAHLKTWLRDRSSIYQYQALDD